MTDRIYDLAIIGGGINGAGIAADAAGRGLSVVLAEMGDLGGATSSASSKLIHGGLRYLEHFEFRLVRESLAEREVLLAKAPHIVRPLRFVLPHVPGMRPRALIRAGLFLYDHLARRRRIPGSRAVSFTTDPAGAPLKAEMTRGFAYWDCWVDDARLVVLNAVAAAEHGADILTRTRVTRCRRESGLWRVGLLADGGMTREVRARVLVNAAGPWADRAVGPEAGRSAAAMARLRLVKGSHIVVPRIAGADDAYLLQSGDGRVVFALPFEDRFTLIGTTDVPFQGDPAAAAASAEEECYLLDLVNRFFARPLGPADIVWRYAGVRPLMEDAEANPSVVSRDYRIELDAPADEAPLIAVLGGKITTYRRLAEAVLERLAPHLPVAGPAWTRSTVLPGGDLGPGGATGCAVDLARRRPGFQPLDILPLVRRHGTRAAAVLGDASGPGDMGENLGGGLTGREVLFLKEQEWARSPDDVLWRRTKAGLHMTPAERERAAERIAGLL